MLNGSARYDKPVKVFIFNLGKDIVKREQMIFAYVFLFVRLGVKQGQLNL